MTGQKKQDDVQESRQILSQIRQETEYGSYAGRTAKRLRDHFDAADAGNDDWIERWGTRIGRAIGLAVTIVLIALFLHYVFTAV